MAKKSPEEIRKIAEPYVRDIIDRITESVKAGKMYNPNDSSSKKIMDASGIITVINITVPKFIGGFFVSVFIHDGNPSDLFCSGVSMSLRPSILRGLCSRDFENDPFCAGGPYSNNRRFATDHIHVTFTDVGKLACKYIPPIDYINKNMDSVAECINDTIEDMLHLYARNDDIETLAMTAVLPEYIANNKLLSYLDIYKSCGEIIHLDNDIDGFIPNMIHSKAYSCVQYQIKSMMTNKYHGVVQLSSSYVNQYNMLRNIAQSYADNHFRYTDGYVDFGFDKRETIDIDTGKPIKRLQLDESLFEWIEERRFRLIADGILNPLYEHPILEDDIREFKKCLKLDIRKKVDDNNETE